MIDLHQALLEVTPMLGWTANDSCSEADAFVPGLGVNSDESSHHRLIEVMPSLRLRVHVATKDLGLQVVGVLVEEPDGGVVGVGHGVGGDEALLVALALGHQPGDGGGWPQIKLEPLMVYVIQQ